MWFLYLCLFDTRLDFAASVCEFVGTGLYLCDICGDIAVIFPNCGVDLAKRSFFSLALVLPVFVPICLYLSV